MTALHRRHMASPVGNLAVIAGPDAVVAICWDTEHELGAGTARNPVEHRLQESEITDVEPGTSEVLDTAIDQLAEYFAGQRTSFDLPLEPTGTEFQRSAWVALTQIPYGRTISYGEQARLMGNANKARAVGAANGKNPIPIVVPCHRVVGSNGALTGFAGGVGVKQWLLAHELQVRSRATPGQRR
ncbi:MAG: methylated-DNA--[protein]-cysteine S-methyltransferase [Beutenbergiaceae bacterium]